MDTGRGGVIIFLPVEVDAVDEVRDTGAGDLEREVLDLVRRSLFVVMLARWTRAVELQTSTRSGDESL
jgi:hypothetical protein